MSGRPLLSVRGRVVRVSASGTERHSSGKLIVETGEGNAAKTYEIPCEPSAAIDLLESDERYPVVQIEVRDVRDVERAERASQVQPARIAGERTG